MAGSSIAGSNVVARLITPSAARAADPTLLGSEKSPLTG